MIEKHVDYQVTTDCLHCCNCGYCTIQTSKITFLRVYDQLIRFPSQFMVKISFSISHNPQPPLIFSNQY